MSGMGLGFFDAPPGGDTSDTIKRRIAYAQALQEQAAQPMQGAYGGLASAGKQIAAALIGKGAENAQNSKYQSLLASTLGDPTTDRSLTLAPAADGEIPRSQLSETQAYNGPLAQGLGQRKSELLGNLLKGVGPEEGTKMLQSAAMQAVDNEDKRLTPMTAQEVSGLGFRPGTVAFKDAFGNPVIKQQSDVQSPEAIAQAVQQHQQEQVLSPDALAQKIQLERLQQGPQWAQLSESQRHNKIEEQISQNPFGTGMGVPGAGSKTGKDFLSTLAPGLASQIQAVGTYRQPAPAGRTSPTGIKFMTLVNQAFPDYDASQYGVKTKARNDFATGKNGNTVRSLNVAVQHLDQLGQLSDALGNGNLQLANKIGQGYAQQTGNPAPTNFDAAKQLVGDEIVKAIVGAGGGVADREQAASNISRASSPQQLRGVIQTYQGLMSGQLSGLKQQYQKTTGLNDFEDYLAPETRQKLETHSASGDQGVPRKVIKFGDLP